MYTLRYPAKDGYFIVVNWHVGAVLCFSALAFSVGFLWQYRRAH
jgi:hypothetical protein